MVEHLFLCGYRGTGKSTIARLLATRLQRPLVDLDQVIQASSGKSIAQIFSESGEAVFRQLESDALQEVVRRVEATVISLGGGTILSPQNRQLIKEHGHCVLLTAEVGTIIERLSADQASRTNRPSLTALPMAEEVRHVLDQRQPLYESVADITIATDDLAPEQVTEKIEAWLNDQEK